MIAQFLRVGLVPVESRGVIAVHMPQILQAVGAAEIIRAEFIVVGHVIKGIHLNKSAMPMPGPSGSSTWGPMMTSPVAGSVVLWPVAMK